MENNYDEYIDNLFCNGAAHKFIYENFNDIVPLGQFHPENRPELESLIGKEFYSYIPYKVIRNKLIRRKVGSKFRFGKYLAIEIYNDIPKHTCGRVKIIRELTDNEKLYYKITYIIKEIFSRMYYTLKRINHVKFNGRKPIGIKEWICVFKNRYKEIKFDINNNNQLV